MKVEHKIVAAFCVIFVILALVGSITYLDYKTLIERDTWVVHTYQVLGQLDKVFGSISEIETGGRGFLLTGKKEYLQPYQAGVGSVGSQVDELQRLVADNPMQISNIADLRVQVNRSIAALNERIELRQTGGLSAVQPLLGLEGKENMDQMRFIIAAMKKQENSLLERRTHLSKQSSRQTLINFALLTALAVVLLITSLYLIRHDLVERRRQDEALRKSDQRFRSVMESAPDAMVISDDNGQIQMANTEAERLFGYTRAELFNQDIGMLLIARAQEEDNEPDGKGSSQQKQDQAIRDLRAVGASFDGVRKDGSLFPLDVSRSPLEVEGEHLFINAVRDRTQQQRAEDALRKYSLDLARSNTELERFAYVASHDLQEPLRMVSSYTQLLSRRYKGKLDPTADEFIAYAVDGANRMQRLINDLLALSRVGTQAKPSEPVDTDAILQRVISDLRQVIETSGAQIVSVEPLPTVLADGIQIGQLFQNLVGNALKFRGEATPRLEIKAAPIDEGKFWQFSFKDNGIGIEPQYFERIFVIFQRLHGKEQYPGTGIGLAICQKIVERLGGRLWVESQPGSGANFCFTLPSCP